MPAVREENLQQDELPAARDWLFHQEVMINSWQILKWTGKSQMAASRGCMVQYPLVEVYWFEKRGYKY